MENNIKRYEFKKVEGYTLETISNLKDLNRDDFLFKAYFESSSNKKESQNSPKSTNDPINANGKFLIPDKSSIYNDFLDYFELYESIFDDNDEREPKAKIIKRILEDSDDSTIINICKNIQGKVIGGFILEYYEMSNCCILTYLFLSEDERGNGLGKILINEGVRWVVQNHLKKRDNSKVEFISAIFLEIETPLYTIFAEKDLKIKEKKEQYLEKRLKFFGQKVKAKWVDIPYVQPRLPQEDGQPDKNQAFHLLLLTLPNIAKQANPFLLDKSVVLTFIAEFYLTVEEKYRKKVDHERYKVYFEQIKEYYTTLKEGKLNKLELKSIFEGVNELDPNLSRILLSIEISDAIDDLDPGNTLSQEKDSFSDSTDKELLEKIGVANHLRGLQIKLKETFNITADQIRDIKLKPLGEEKKIADNAKGLSASIAKIISDNEKALRPTLENIFKTFKEIYLDKNFGDANNDFYLREVPKFRQPNLNFDKTAIAIHLVRRQDAKREKQSENHTKEEKRKTYCPYFHSFEKDLFSLRYHNSSPYTSKVYASFKIKVTFPYEIQFLSEGRQETIFINAEKETDYFVKTASTNDGSKIHYDEYTKEIQCKLNYIYFKESGIRIWEIVFNNYITNDNITIPLNEFEIIQFSKFFTGKQERNLPTFSIEFEDVAEKINSKAVEILEYLRGLCANKDNKSTNSNYAILCGTIQIDTKEVKILDSKKENFVRLFEEEEQITENQKRLSIEKKLNLMQESFLKDNVNDEQLLRNLYGVDENFANKRIYYTDLYSNIRLSNEGKEQRDFERNYNENNYLNIILNFMCGVSLGIFDYERMGYPEVLDTLKPMSESATDDYMIILQRSSLICFCHDDSVFETAKYTIGISPYLIIPNSVLAHNHYIAAEKIDKLREYGLKNKLTIGEKKIISNLLKPATEGTFEPPAQEKGIIYRLFNRESGNDLYSLKVQVSDKIKFLRENSIVKEVFNYATETEIYQYGMDYRTTNQFLNTSKESDSLFKSQIDEFREDRRSSFEFLTEALLALIGLLQIKSLFRDILDPIGVLDVIYTPANASEQLKFENTVDDIFLFVMIGLYIWFIVRINKKRSKMYVKYDE